jgi:hypothetical protein
MQVQIVDVEKLFAHFVDSADEWIDEQEYCWTVRVKVPPSWDYLRAYGALDAWLKALAKKYDGAYYVVAMARHPESNRVHIRMVVNASFHDSEELRARWERRWKRLGGTASISPVRPEKRLQVLTPLLRSRDSLLMFNRRCMSIKRQYVKARR